MSETSATVAPAAVLWDMDGTLIDSEDVWLEAELAMLARYDITLSQEVQDQLVGSGLRAAAAVFQELGVTMTIPEIIAEWRDTVISGLLSAEPQWRPGALELLASLKAAGIPSALVTMSVRPIADAVVALLPQGSFAAIVAGDEVDREKPDPEPYLRGAAALGVPIEQCLAIEDSPTGLRSAYAAGAVAIGVPNHVDLTQAPKHELWPTLSGFDAAALTAHFSELRRSNPELPTL